MTHNLLAIVNDPFVTSYLSDLLGEYDGPLEIVQSYSQAVTYISKNNYSSILFFTEGNVAEELRILRLLYSIFVGKIYVIRWETDALKYEYLDMAHYVFNLPSQNSLLLAKLKQGSCDDEREKQEAHIFYTCRGITVVPSFLYAFCGHHILQLSLKEFELLHILIRNKGRVVDYQTLVDHVWNYDFDHGSNESIKSSAARIRREIAQYSKRRYIEAIPGYGYRFVVFSPNDTELI